MTTHSSILALEILWIEESGGLHTVLGVTDSDMTDGLSTHTHTHRAKENSENRTANQKKIF